MKKNTDLLFKEMTDDIKKKRKKEERQTRRRITKMSLFLVGVFLICNGVDCVWWLLRQWDMVVYMSSKHTAGLDTIFIQIYMDTLSGHTGILSSFLVQIIYLHYLTAPRGARGVKRTGRT